MNTIILNLGKTKTVGTINEKVTKLTS